MFVASRLLIRPNGNVRLIFVCNFRQDSFARELSVSVSSVCFQFALHVYTQLIDVGQKYGIRHAGYYAMRALRVERFFAFWGQDLDTTTTPLECGRSWRVKFDVSLLTGRHLIYLMMSLARTV
jgi:hypothetical protein